MRKYTSWKNFVMNTYQKRFNELLKTIDLIAFHDMDERLMNYLEETARTNKTKVCWMVIGRKSMGALGFGTRIKFNKSEI